MKLALSLGERVARPGATGEGALAPSSLPLRRFRPFTHYSDKTLRVLQHQPIRQPQYANAKSSEEGVPGGVLSDLAGLRVDASVEFHGHTAFAAVEIDNIIFDRVLAAEFQAQPPVAQQMPGGLFGFGLRVAQFADALSPDSQGGSNPSPAPALRGTLSPGERAAISKFPGAGAGSW